MKNIFKHLWQRIVIMACAVFILNTAVFAAAIPAITSGQLYMRLSAQSGIYSNTAMTQTASNRGTVAAWQDSSGSGRNAVQSVSENQPVYLTNVVNGKPVVRFDGVDNYMQVNFGGTLAQPSTFFLVIDTRNYQNEYIFDGLTSGSRHYLAIGSNTYPGKWMFGAATVLYSEPVVQSRLMLHTLVFNGADTSHYINGVLQKTANGGTHSLAGLTLGSRYSLASYYADFDLADFIIYQNALSSNDRAAIEDFLMDEYIIRTVCKCATDGNYPLADLSKDNAINFKDMNYVGADWLTYAQSVDSYSSGDINKDCVVNLKDLALLSMDWLTPADEIALLRYSAQEPVHTDVFWQGMDGIHTYRIPAAVTTDSGTILAFAEARKTSSSDKTPTKLVVRRSTNGGISWLACQTIMDDGLNALMDPCPVIDKTTGRIWLFYARYPYGWDGDNPVAGLGLDSCTVWVTYSDDEGATWSTAENITSDIKLADWTNYNLGPGVGIQKIASPYLGRLIVPCSHGGGTVGNNHIIYSDDNGQNWHLGAGYIKSGSESQVVEISNGWLLANIRNGGIVGRRTSVSSNGGASWSSINYDPELIEPVCQASILRFTKSSEDDRNRILFSNPASGCERVNMTVKMSYDECNNWPVAKKISSGPAGYSCLTVLPDKKIGCLYECGTSHYYEKITFATFSVEWLTDEADYIY